MCETNILYYLCGCYVKDVRRTGCGPYLKTQDPHCAYMDRYEDRRMEECFECAAETKRGMEMSGLEKAGSEDVAGGSESGEEEEYLENEGLEEEYSKDEEDLEDEGSEVEDSAQKNSREEGPEKEVENGVEEQGVMIKDGKAPERMTN